MKRIPNINHLYTNGEARGVTFAALKYGNSAHGARFIQKTLSTQNGQSKAR